jgi:uncharacterized protein (TIGR00369 family)
VNAGARLDRLKAIIDSDAYAKTLGLDVELRGDSVRTITNTTEDLVGNVNLPALHGGVVGSLLMLTAALQLNVQMAEDERATLLDIDVDYLRSGRVIQTFGSATLIRKGRRAATLAARLWQEDEQRPIASGRMSFLLQRSEEAPLTLV